MEQFEHYIAATSALRLDMSVLVRFRSPIATVSNLRRTNGRWTLIKAHRGREVRN